MTDTTVAKRQKVSRSTLSEVIDLTILDSIGQSSCSGSEGVIDLSSIPPAREWVERNCDQHHRENKLSALSKALAEKADLQRQLQVDLFGLPS